VLAWLTSGTATNVTMLRRLQLATQRSGAPAFLFRPLTEAARTSPAELRLVFEPHVTGGRVQLLKSRGGARRPLELRWQEFSLQGNALQDHENVTP
jgi:hypothetical protein